MSTNRRALLQSKSAAAVLGLLRVMLAAIVWPMAIYAQTVASSVPTELGPWPTDQMDSVGHRQSPAPLGTPGEMRVDVEILRTNGADAIPPAAPTYPQEALRAGVVTRARVWLDSLSSLTVRGLHLTPYGQLAVAGDRETLAQQQLVARLATRGLSPADRAFVLYAGAMAFADKDHPEWLPIAEQYLTRLVALGTSQGGWQFLARARLAQVYYALDQRPRALEQGLRAYALLPYLPFEDHLLALEDHILGPGERSLSLTVADLLLGMPGTAEGLAKLHALDSLLILAARPLPDRIQLDSTTYWKGLDLIQMVRDDSAFAVTLGHPAPPIVGDFWINRHDTTAYRVDDGQIHLLDFFLSDEPLGQAEQVSLMRIQARLGPSVQVVGVGALTGYWGEQFVEPPDEALRWGQFLQQELKVTFPITYGVQDKVRTAWGGRVPDDNPNIAAYHVPKGMGVIVVDQHGRVRRWFDFGRDEEDAIVQFVTKLKAEGGAS